MTKHFTKAGLMLALLLISGTVSAAVYWNVAVFIWTGTAVLVTAAAMAGAAPILVAGTLATGAVAGVIGIYWDNPTAPTNLNGTVSSKGMSIILKAEQPLVTPAGWTAGTLQNEFEPTPPESKPPTQPFGATVQQFYDVATNQYVCSGTLSPPSQCRYTGDTLNQLKAAIAVDGFKNYPYAIAVEIEGADSMNPAFELSHTMVYDSGGGNISQLYTPQKIQQKPQCEAGYSLKTFVHPDSGQTLPDYNNVGCQLTNPNAVKKPKDDVCETRVKLGTFANAKNDPDCTNNLITGSGTNQLQAITPSKAIYAVTSAQGDVTIYEKFYDTATNKTVTNIASIGSSAEVQYLQTVNALGNSVTVNPISNGSGTGSGSGTEGGATDGKLDEIFDSDGAIGDKTSLPIPDSTLNPFGESFSPLKAFTVPTQAGECPTGQFELFGDTHSFDAQCTLFEEQKPKIQLAMTFVWSILGMVIVLKA